MLTLKKTIAFCCLLLPALTLCGCQEMELPPESEKPAAALDVTGTFQAAVLKVGKADAIILHTDNHCAVIDCGEVEDGQEIVDYLQKEEIENIDYLFITHFDKDHVGGFPTVIEQMSVDKIIVPDYEGSNDEYAAYEEIIDERQLAPVKLHETMSFSLDDVSFEVYPPLKDYYAESDNDYSIVVSAVHGENSFLFTGDAMDERLAEVLEQTNHASFDFLKVPHHGNWNKNLQKFIETTEPDYSVITCSKKNPAEEKTLYWLENVGSRIYMTTDGDIYTASDGSKITVSQ